MARRGLKNTKVRIAAIGAGLAIGAAVITGVASASVAGPEPDPNKTQFQGWVDCEVGEEGAKLISPLLGELRDTEGEAQNDLPALEEQCSAKPGVVLTSSVLRV
jgi:hypothetical protein